jgi:deoxyribose-phosphate aldolase
MGVRFAARMDMVINRGAFLAGRYEEVAEEIRAVKRACLREDGTAAHLKVILETGELETLDAVRFASDLAIRAMDGVDAEWEEASKRAIEREGRPFASGDFIKTSTGKVQPAATMPVTLVMLEAVRDWYLGNRTQGRREARRRHPHRQAGAALSRDGQRDAEPAPCAGV